MRIVTFLLTLFLVGAQSGICLGLEASENPEARPLAVGMPFPSFALHGNLTKSGRAYLGLPGAGPYSLDQIKAKVVIVEVFSMYCPHCQNEAPVANELHALLKSRKLDKNMKLIGLGAGNSEFEVKVFAEKYEVEFPLFEDPDFVAHKLMGQVGTPFFYVLVADPGHAGFRVTDTYLGRLPTARRFLDRVISVTKTGKEAKP